MNPSLVLPLLSLAKVIIELARVWASTSAITSAHTCCHFTDFLLAIILLALTIDNDPKKAA